MAVTIPAGTTASLNGGYRVVNLPSPIALVPGNYELGGLDTFSTTDPIRYLVGQYGSPVVGMTQGPFFYAGMGPPTTILGITDYLYLLDGLELGPMLFIAVPKPSTPHIDITDVSFGMGSNVFGFKISCGTNIPVVIEATTNLAAAEWVPLRTITLTNGSIYFSDPPWTNYPSRFYRVRSP
jgi:hypothetical protein